MGWLVSDHVVRRGLRRVGRCRASDMGDEPWTRMGRCASAWIRTRPGSRWPGTVRNSVYGRAVEPQPARALVKRSPKRRAEWALAIAPPPGGILHSLSARVKNRK